MTGDTADGSAASSAGSAEVDPLITRCHAPPFSRGAQAFGVLSKGPTQGFVEDVAAWQAQSILQVLSGLSFNAGIAVAIKQQ